MVRRVPILKVAMAIAIAPVTMRGAGGDEEAIDDAADGDAAEDLRDGEDRECR